MNYLFLGFMLEDYPSGWLSSIYSPGSLRQPTRFEFIVNLRAAQQIGLRILPNVLARVDRGDSMMPY